MMNTSTQKTSVNKLVNLTNKYKEIWTTGNVDEFDDTLSKDFIRIASGKQQSGIAELKELVRLTHELYQDLKVKGVENIVADNKVITRIKVTGTFKQTNKSFAINGLTIYEIQNGKIVKQWAELDELGGFMQVGMTLNITES